MIKIKNVILVRILTILSLVYLQNFLKVLFFASLFFYPVFPAFADSFIDDYNRAHHIELLYNKKFSELEEDLSRYQSQYESGQHSDAFIELGYSAFDTFDPNLENLLKSWIEQSPDSYVPYLSRGIYFYYTSQALRGAAFSSKTPKIRMRKMREVMLLAIDDLQKALVRNPKLTIAYAYHIRLAMRSGGGRDEINKYVEKGLAIDNASYLVRRANLLSLYPKWHGSYPELENFIADTKKSLTNNPDLNKLLGFVEGVKADSANIDENYEDALVFIDAALQKGQYPEFLQARGKYFYRLKQYENALSDLNTALQIQPGDTDMLGERSKIHLEMGNEDKALADLDYALALNPYHSTNLKSRAYTRSLVENYEGAVEDLNLAAYYDPFDPWVWYSTGLYLSKYMGQSVRGANAYELAVNLAPDNPKYWYNYIRVLYDLKDCRYKEAVEGYLAACGGIVKKHCSQKRLDWGEKTLESIKKIKSCKNNRNNETIHINSPFTRKKAIRGSKR